MVQSGCDSDDVREAFGSMAWTRGNASPQQEYPQTVNRAVSLNAIKYQALDLLFSNEPLDPLLEKLTALFLSNSCLDRQHRNPPRKKSSARTLLRFQKREKKHCF